MANQYTKKKENESKAAPVKKDKGPRRDRNSVAAAIKANEKRDGEGRSDLKALEANSFRVRLEDESLSVTIPADRWAIYSANLAETLQEIDRVEDEKALFMEQIKARLSELDAKQRNLTPRVASRREFDIVKIKVFYLNSGKKVFVRLDTREIFRTMEITEAEYQMELFKNEAKKTAEKPKDKVGEVGVALQKAQEKAKIKAAKAGKGVEKAGSKDGTASGMPEGATVAQDAPKATNKESAETLKKWIAEDGATIPETKGGAK
jgi:hypothetical protein